MMMGYGMNTVGQPMGHGTWEAAACMRLLENNRAAAAMLLIHVIAYYKYSINNKYSVLASY